MTTLLHTAVYGESNGDPLIVVHGLFGSSRNWRALAKHFSRKRRVIAVDMRNHGASFRHASNTYRDMADDLAAVIKDIGGRADVLGHSMGGKAAMVLALTHPDLVSRLLVADIAPVRYLHSQGANIEAMRNLPLDRLTRRSDADKLLLDLVPEPAVRAFLLGNLVLDPSGNHWLLNLDALADNLEHIMGFPEVSERFDGPTLFIHGAASTYVLPEHHAVNSELFPKATYHRIEDAGHWLHADKPREFISALENWL